MQPLNLGLNWPKIHSEKAVCALFNICRYSVAKPVGGRGGRVPPWQQKNCQKSGKRGKNLGKSGKIWKNQEMIGKWWGKYRENREKNWEMIGKISGRFFHFAPPDKEGWLRHCRYCIFARKGRGIAFRWGCKQGQLDLFNHHLLWLDFRNTTNFNQISESHLKLAIKLTRLKYAIFLTCKLQKLRWQYKMGS